MPLYVNIIVLYINNFYGAVLPHGRRQIRTLFGPFRTLFAHKEIARDDCSRKAREKGPKRVRIWQRPYDRTAP